jgi:glycerol kinase
VPPHGGFLRGAGTIARCCPHREKTGLIIDPYFSASKIRWILDHVPDAMNQAKDGEILFGTIDTWILWNLTGRKLHLTDYTNASRTMLMDLSAGDWDNELLSIFDVPRAILPAIVPPSGRVGAVYPELPGAEIPISGMAGDQQAALAGQPCFRSGLSKNTYGTGCFALTHTGYSQPHSTHRLISTRAASMDCEPRFALEGSVFVGGAVIQWLRDELALIHSSSRFGTSRPERARLRRCSCGAGVRGSGRASLGLGRAGRDQRPDSSDKKGAYYSGCARKYCVSDLGSYRGNGG